MDQQLIDSKKKYNKVKKELEIKSNHLSTIRLIIFIIIIIFLILNYNYHLIIYKILIIISIFIFIPIVIYHSKIVKKLKKSINYLNIISRYEDRLSNKWQEDQEDIKSDITFLNDLDITGTNSLFKYLNFTTTLGGKKHLLDLLSLKKINKTNIKENQDSIKELKDNFDITLKFLEISSNEDNMNKTDFKDYLYFFDNDLKFNKIPFIISIILSIISIIIFIIGCFNIIPLSCFLIMLIIQTIIAYIYVFIHGEEFEKIATCSRIFKKLTNIYNYIENINFKSSNNIKLQNNIIKGNKILHKLDKLSHLDSYRENFITNIILNTFISLNFLIYYKYINLLIETKKNNQFKSSIESLEELECLISLTTITYTKKNICIPNITDKIEITFNNIAHPLIEENKCITNNFSTSEYINIITGSNMSGKTSFMKTIAINLTLAYLGTYVNATSFTCSIMKIFTSINVKDDISKSISTFYGELLRIKDIIDYNDKHPKEPLVIFIDEIFKGTNYNDRITGAKSVLNKLSKLNCIVFLTTHDFELCEIKNKLVHNYHFEEKYHGNKISFDYKIKEGKCSTTNAEYLMKQMKIMDD